MNKKILDIFVPGEPIGKGRHQTKAVLKWTKNREPYADATHYACPRSRQYEDSIRKLAVQSGVTPTRNPVRVRMTACFECATSYPTWKQKLAYLGWFLPTMVPDIDNIEKSVLDGLNPPKMPKSLTKQQKAILKAARATMRGAVWVDDAQVVEMISAKTFDVSEGVRIRVDELPAMPVSITTKKEADQFLASHNTSVDELLV